jgi:hypothetical protein
MNNQAHAMSTRILSEVGFMVALLALAGNGSEVHKISD